MCAHVCTSGPASCVQRQYRLHCHVCKWNIKGLKHELDGTLAVLTYAHYSLGQQYRVILTTHPQLLKGMTPDLHTQKHL